MRAAAIIAGAGCLVGCFPGPLRDGAASADDTAATTDGADTDTVTSVSDATTADDAVEAGCVTTDDCRDLVTACRDAVCQADGSCLTVAKSTGTCDDGDDCTHDDTCVSGQCHGVDYVCDDGLSCTRDICDGHGGCLTQQLADTCLVDGACHPRGERNPDNACQLCVDGRSWSDADTGSCEDGDPCTTGDSCDAGQCVGGGAPDDSASDWVASVMEGAAVSATAVVRTSADGVWLLGGITGPGTVLGEDVAAAVTSQVIIRIGPDGKPLWKALVNGASRVRLLGDTATPGVDVAIESDDVVVFEGPSGSMSVLDTATVGQRRVLHVDPAGTATNGPIVALLPITRSGTGWIGNLSYRQSVEIQTDEGMATLALAAGSTVDSALAFMRVDGSAAWVRSVSGTSDIRDITISTDGDISILVGGRGALTFQSRGTTSTSDWPESQFVLARYSTLGELVSARRVISGTDWINFGSSFDHMQILPIPGGATVVVGRISGDRAHFGVAPNDVEYATGQFYGTEGEMGALGDGFVARYTAAGVLDWVRFLKPLDAPDGYPGAELLRGTFDGSDDHLYVTGFASGTAAFLGDVPTEYLDLTTYRGALLVLSSEGRLRSEVIDTRAPKDIISAAPRKGIYVTGEACAPDARPFGRTPATTESCVVYVEHLGSAGGLVCPSPQ